MRHARRMDSLERARWALSFVASTLEALPPAELKRLARQVLSTHPDEITGTGPDLDSAPMVMEAFGHAPLQRTLPVLQRLQRQAKAGLDALLDGGAWALPKLPARVFVLAKGDKLIRRYEGEFEAHFYAGVADAVAEHWGRVRRCATPECRRPFVAEDGRQKYHSAACGQAARWAAFAPTRRRDYRAEYLERVRRKTGQRKVRGR